MYTALFFISMLAIIEIRLQWIKFVGPLTFVIAEFNCTSYLTLILLPLLSSNEDTTDQMKNDFEAQVKIPRNVLKGEKEMQFGLFTQSEMESEFHQFDEVNCVKSSK